MRHLYDYDQDRFVWNLRAIALCLISLAVCGLVTGCGKSTDPDQPELSDDDDFKPPMDLVLSAVAIDETNGKVYPVYVPHMGGGR